MTAGCGAWIAATILAARGYSKVYHIMGTDTYFVMLITLHYGTAADHVDLQIHCDKVLPD
jgi:hypothetical protein